MIVKERETLTKPNEAAMNDKRIAYILWLGCLLGASGLHRLYNRKFFSGFLWLFTWGFFGIGQFVDLFLISDMVEDHNLKYRAKHGLLPTGVPLTEPAAIAAPYITRDQLAVKLVKAAAIRGGRISVTQGVMDTGASFNEVESALKTMYKAGYVGMDNHPDTGAVVYVFHEL